MMRTNVIQSVANTAAATHFSAVAQISGASPVATGNFSITKGPSSQQKSAPPGSSSELVNVHKPMTQGKAGIDVSDCDC